MFDDAIKYLTRYREERVKALNNETRMRWFASGDEDNSTPAYTISDIIDVFDTTAENAALAVLDASTNPSFADMEAERLKIAFMAGVRHDLRNQFAVGTGHERKTPLDFIRHAIGDVLTANYLTKVAAQAIKNKKAKPKPEV